MKSKKMTDAVNAAALLAIAEMVPKNAWLDCSGYINRVHIFQHVTGQVLPPSSDDVLRTVSWHDEPQDREFLAAVDKAWDQVGGGAAMILLRKFAPGMQSLVTWLVGQVASAKAFAKVLDTVNACENDWVVRNREAVLKCYAMIYLAYPTKASYKQLVHPEVMCFITRALHTNYIYDTLELKSARISWPVLHDFLNCQPVLSSMVLTVHGRDEWKAAMRGDQVDGHAGNRMVSEFFVRYEDGDYNSFLGEHKDIIWDLIK